MHPQNEERNSGIRVSDAVNQKGSHFMADFFGSDCLNDDKMSEETHDICKAFLTNSWMRTNTKARLTEEKTMDAWKEKEDARLALYEAERNGTHTPQDIAQMVKKWNKSYFHYRKLVELYFNPHLEAMLVAESEAMREFIEVAKKGTGSCFLI